MYNLPFNMNTFHQLWGVTTPAQAKAKIQEQIAQMHIVEPKNLEEQALALVGKDVYLDTAVIFDYIEQEQFLRILRGHGSDRILFATDSPWSGQRESLSHLRSMKLSQEVFDAILGGNALRLLGGMA